MNARSGKATTRIATAERILAGPVPVHRIEWHVTLITDTVLHEGHGSKPFQYRGVRLYHLGAVSWSRMHHEYRVRIGRGNRELEEALTASPVSALRDLARRLDVLPEQLHAQSGEIRQPRCPDGLCSRCWRQGVRRLGRTCSYRLEPDGFLLVAREFLGDFCDEHAAQVNAVPL